MIFGKYFIDGKFEFPLGHKSLLLSISKMIKNKAVKETSTGEQLFDYTAFGGDVGLSTVIQTPIGNLFCDVRDLEENAGSSSPSKKKIEVTLAIVVRNTLVMNTLKNGVKNGVLKVILRLHFESSHYFFRCFCAVGHYFVYTPYAVYQATKNSKYYIINYIIFSFSFQNKYVRII